MKVMLIQPPSSYKLEDKFDIYEPLALEYLGAALKEEKHEVIVHDAPLEPDYKSVFSSYKPDVVGLTGFTPHVNIIKRIAAGLSLKIISKYEPGRWISAIKDIIDFLKYFKQEYSNVQ